MRQIEKDNSNNNNNNLRNSLVFDRWPQKKMHLAMKNTLAYPNLAPIFFHHSRKEARVSKVGSSPRSKSFSEMVKGEPKRGTSLVLWKFCRKFFFWGKKLHRKKAGTNSNLWCTWKTIETAFFSWTICSFSDYHYRMKLPGLRATWGCDELVQAAKRARM